jgi:PKD repeat protein
MNTFRTMTALALLVGVLAAPLPVSAAREAQGGLTVTVETTASCADAQFVISIEGGAAPYALAIDFGDGEQTISSDGLASTVMTHAYAAGGSYAWSVTATSDELSGQAGGTLVIGPSVTLTSDPFPPLLPLVEGGASLTLMADVTGGAEPYTYAWTLDGTSASTSDPASPTASATYSAGGKYTAGVAVTDSCGLTAEDTLTIVVDDPLAEGCHPTAQWIADAVNTLFPQQSEQLYTCKDIYSYFTGGLTGSQLGFGIMRHAYALAETIPDLTWEEILDWRLDGSGWGLLTQLDRVDEALDEVGILELIERVASGENSVADIRAAARVAVRYEADFAGALDLLAAGASNGELGQIYRAAQELGVDPAVIAGYEELGIRAAELEQAARVAERLGTDWAAVLEVHAGGESWGSIRKGDESATQSQGNGQGNGQGQGSQPDKPKGNQIQEQVNVRVAEQLAAKYGVSVEQVQAMYAGTCSQDWGCVRTTLREQYSQHGKGKDK